jgi:hypothetical protein
MLHNTTTLVINLKMFMTRYFWFLFRLYGVLPGTHFQFLNHFDASVQIYDTCPEMADGAEGW